MSKGLYSSTKGLYGPTEGLYSSLYADEGVYNKLYSHGGSSAEINRTDIRLGGLGQEEPADAPMDDLPASETAPLGPPAPPGESFFEREYKGIPLWLVGVFFLGFAIAYRRLKKTEVS